MLLMRSRQSGGTVRSRGTQFFGPGDGDLLREGAAAAGDWGLGRETLEKLPGQLRAMWPALCFWQRKHPLLAMSSARLAGLRGGRPVRRLDEEPEGPGVGERPRWEEVEG